MKIWCEACEGTGEVDAFGYDVCDCPECNGKGYTENETIERENRIGKGVIEALESHASISLQYTYDFVTSETIEQLLMLGKSEVTP